MKIAVLTGASAGMGREFFKNLQGFCELDEIWIIARRADRLEEMTQESKIKTRAVALDLADRKSISVLEDMLRAENPDIRILINNAGFGKLGYVYELKRETQMDMVELNCAAVREELKPCGINALAVCPGPMSTEFLDVAGISGGKSKTFEMLPYCNPAAVAKKSLALAQKGRAVYTPRFFFKLYRVLARVLPHGLVMKLSKT